MAGLNPLEQSSESVINPFMGRGLCNECQLNLRCFLIFRYKR